MVTLIFLLAVTAFLIFLLFLSVKPLGEGEYGVVFHSGAPRGGKRGPGLVFLTPFLESMTRVDVRPRTVGLVVKEWSLDGTRAEVEVTVRYRVSDPERSVVAAGDYVRSTERVMRSALGDMISRTNAGELAASVESINRDLRNTANELTSPWGVEIMGLRVEAVRQDRR
jgi:regulator of protease activity HflC (stomatin/prohibitin superfamily)